MNQILPGCQKPQNHFTRNLALALLALAVAYAFGLYQGRQDAARSEMARQMYGCPR